jgi:hypothetical protein
MGASASTISAKALEEIQESLGEDKAILSISNKELLVIPPLFIPKAAHLKELKLSNTKLAALPASFGYLELLE